MSGKEMFTSSCLLSPTGFLALQMPAFGFRGLKLLLKAGSLKSKASF
eukprot:CAMPEP_0197660440 /NCGR_PEP_ID=MMETSP1338-20131121/50846_1 /TAXON_ID=43686 ORGANISM="Pelagodinium beii, Strain RCC1491" /NCGR_SAMPLE_ID=MMETSP1338 /ASSEMBLY_ACC=CAM_ASM_000754 /LENGTH=46 /DNA_ID= /DNA_START= /DNA_END= /DNA_ORIENTATION=